MSNEYKIIKLKSGESVIARIQKVNKDNASVLLHRPMSLKVITIFDDVGMQSEEKFCIKRYNDFSIDRIVEIPTNYIVSVLTPTQRTIEIYDREKIFEDNPQLKFIAQRKAEHEAFREFMKKQKRIHELAEKMGFGVEDVDEPTPANFSALMLPNESLKQLLEMIGLDWQMPVDKPPNKNTGLEPDPEDWGYGCKWQDWNIDDFVDDDDDDDDE